MRAVSLFTGSGGADLAAQWAGIEIVAMSEIDPYCCKVLDKNFPAIPNLGNVCSITKESFYAATGLYTVDLVYGGFHCQPFSFAGMQRGDKDDRHLWPEMLRIVNELKPAWVVGENVAGFIHMALDDALSDMEAEGYETRTFVLPACGVGAPHRRYRVFFVGYLSSEGERGLSVQPRGSQQKGADALGRGKTVSNSHRIRQQEAGCLTCGQKEKHSLSACRSCPEAPRRTDWWAVEPCMGRVAHGVPNRVDRIRALGNAIVPQVIYPIFKAIVEAEDE